ncbi:hypothetical protein JKP88DRAFT_247016 [Tribonema minus]|uniref:Uncharacterized protein n=1 Tax=Tribonema minus TaxID=303371 RepID=A0A836CBE3_9STRA|nr:hypothetical protein JKP88DRAFT_247016 [Tribonema minus]
MQHTTCDSANHRLARRQEVHGEGQREGLQPQRPLPTSIPLPKELTRMFLQQEDGKEDHVHDSSETRSCLRPSKYQRVNDGYGTEATASASESVSSGGSTSGGGISSWGADTYGGGAHAMPCGIYYYMLILQQRQTAAMKQMAAATAAAQATSAASQATLAAVLAHVQCKQEKINASSAPSVSTAPSTAASPITKAAASMMPPKQYMHVPLPLQYILSPSLTPYSRTWTMSDYDSDTSTVVDMATVDMATVDIIASAKTALGAALAFLQWTEQQTLRSCHCIVIGFHGMEGHFDLDVRHNGEVIGCWRDVCVLPWFVKGDASPYDDDFYPEIVK